MISAETWIDLGLKALTLTTTTIVAFYVAGISRRQWFTNREKLRLDLYDRRFKIYVQVMEFHKALVVWDGSEEQKKLVDPFIQASREAKFLFPEKSGVFSFLTEFSKHAFFITNFDKLKDLSSMDQKLFSKHFEKRVDSVNWILQSMEPLEQKLGPFLNFHDM
jgi:hypothetical protein